MIDPNIKAKGQAPQEMLTPSVLRRKDRNLSYDIICAQLISGNLLFLQKLIEFYKKRAQGGVRRN
jgi:hypothetical protein